jgi:glycosyltransferase involved in cell wall biosynthesis
VDFRPDYVLASSGSLKRRFEAIGIPCCLLPNGVDTEKFVPVPDFEKLKLRKKYDIQENRFTILHVGHLSNARNLDLFIKLSKENEVVIVCSEYIEVDQKILKKLGNEGCTIFQKYFPCVEEFYQLSDCYLFPVKPGNSILCPLSIMEAMSCNLPVVTTEFDGIQTFFEQGDGLKFVKKEADFFDAIDDIKRRFENIATRKKVERYSWKSLSKAIAKIYDGQFSDVIKNAEKLTNLGNILVVQ